MEKLLREMERMFDLRPGRLALRREFESRIWGGSESFCDYYHDKMILANRVPIAEDEILDYIIEGVTDQQLRNQARMLNCRAGTDLLRAFERIQLEGGKAGEAKARKDGSRATSAKKAETSATGGVKKCYRCHEAGHVAAHCKRAATNNKRACYVCGSTEHMARECSKRNQSSTSEASKNVTRAAITNVVHSVDLPKPYMVRVKITPESTNDKCVYVIDAMVDSGSPISLVRSDVIPCESRCDEEGERPFCGINGSRLRVDGVFFGRLDVNGVQVKIKFYAVPDGTMAFDVLLGRDFLNCPQLHVTFGESIKIAGAEEMRAINSLMHIDCGDSVVRSCDELKINPAIGDDVSARIREIYESRYLERGQAEENASEFEMIIALKHEQPISSRPRRLSFADKEVLREILDDLLKN